MYNQAEIEKYIDQNDLSGSIVVKHVKAVCALYGVKLIESCEICKAVYGNTWDAWIDEVNRQNEVIE
jgi:hypothetical protein